MRKLRTLLLTLTLAAVAAGAAWAHSVTYEAASGPLYSFSMPAGWSFRVNGDRLVAAPPDSRMWFGTWELQREDLPSEAEDNVEGYLDAYFDSVKVDPVVTGTLNGMTVHRFNGKAHYNGNPVRFAVVVFEPKPKAICVAIGVWDDETAVQEGPVQATLESLRPAPGG